MILFICLFVATLALIINEIFKNKDNSDKKAFITLNGNVYVYHNGRLRKVIPKKKFCYTHKKFCESMNKKCSLCN